MSLLISSCSDSSSWHFKAHRLCSFVEKSCGFSWSNPQWCHLRPPVVLPLHELGFCLKMYLFSHSFWKQRKPIIHSPPCHWLARSLCLSIFFAGDANDPPSVFWCKVCLHFSLSSTYKCALIASSPSGLLRCLFEICRLISTSLAKSPQWLQLSLMWVSYRVKKNGPSLSDMSWDTERLMLDGTTPSHEESSGHRPSFIWPGCRTWAQRHWKHVECAEGLFITGLWQELL